ncbi:MAG: class I SAM-dependent methyltransferase [Actinobacteria bacterium]|nr:class I SAM-dependent methyltransferase [Actinomycetota bacterium]
MPDPATFPDTLEAVRYVEGWMTPGQARLLWDSAREVPAGGRIVEIGSFRGRSTIVLARAADPTVEVVAIDPHGGNDRGPQELAGFTAEAAEDHAVFNENLENAGVRDRVRHVRAWSSAAHPEVDDPLDLLYIDGAHRYGPALADIRDWGDRVRPGGTMLIHDSFSSIGVTLALARHLFASPTWHYVGREGSMTEYRREGRRRDAKARAANLARHCRALPWFVRNLAIKGLLVAHLKPVTRLLGYDQEMVWPH